MSSIIKSASIVAFALMTQDASAAGRFQNVAQNGGVYRHPKHPQQQPMLAPQRMTKRSRRSQHHQPPQQHFVQEAQNAQSFAQQQQQQAMQHQQAMQQMAAFQQQLQSQIASEQSAWLTNQRQFEKVTLGAIGNGDNLSVANNVLKLQNSVPKEAYPATTKELFDWLQSTSYDPALQLNLSALKITQLEKQQAELRKQKEEQDRQAAIEAQRQAALEAERQRQAEEAAKIERQREAARAREAERKRKAAQEAEHKRQAAIRAEQYQRQQAIQRKEYERQQAEAAHQQAIQRQQAMQQQHAYEQQQAMLQQQGMYINPQATQQNMRGQWQMPQQPHGACAPGPRVSPTSVAALEQQRSTSPTTKDWVKSLTFQEDGNFGYAAPLNNGSAPNTNYVTPATQRATLRGAGQGFY